MARLTLPQVRLASRVKRMNTRLAAAQNGKLKNISGVKYVKELKYNNLGFLVSTSKSGNVKLTTSIGKLTPKQTEALIKVLDELENKKVTTKTQLKNKVANERKQERRYAEELGESTAIDEYNESEEELLFYGVSTEEQLLMSDDYLADYEKARAEITFQAMSKAYYFDGHISNIREAYLAGAVSEEDEKAIVTSRLTRLYMQKERNIEGDVFDADIKAMFHKGYFDDI